MNRKDVQLRKDGVYYNGSLVFSGLKSENVRYNNRGEPIMAYDLEVSQLYTIEFSNNDLIIRYTDGNVLNIPIE